MSARCAGVRVLWAFFYKYFWAEISFIRISFSSIRMHPSLASSDKARASEDAPLPVFVPLPAG